MGKWDKMRGLLPDREKESGSRSEANGRLNDFDYKALDSGIKSLVDLLASDTMRGLAGATCLKLNLQETIDKFAMIRNLKSVVRLIEKILNKSMATLNDELIEHLNNIGMSSVATDNYTCFLESSIYPGVEDPDALREWLTKTGHGELLSIHSGKLRTLAATHLTEGKGQIPGVKVWFDETARVRKK